MNRIVEQNIGLRPHFSCVPIFPAFFLQSSQTADTDKAMNDVTFKLPDLLKMIFDPNLFYNDPSNKDAPLPNLIEHLVRHEAGGVDGVQTKTDSLDNIITEADKPDVGRYDSLNGSGGNDIIAGKAGSDILNAKEGDDLLYADSPISVPDGYSDAPRNRLEGDQGNIIDGGAGNDFIAAGTGADYVHGGAANDNNYDLKRSAA